MCAHLIGRADARAGICAYAYHYTNKRGRSSARVADIVLALGFDLFFKPKLSDAAARAGVELRYAAPADAARAAAGAARVVADISAPGVEAALGALRAAHPALPMLVCYPHVEVARAEAARALGAAVVTRGHFAQHLAEAVAGKLE